MGHFSYGGDLFLMLDDRTLAHFQAIVGAKLRKGESFLFNFTNEPGGKGSTTIWLNPTMHLIFTYDEVERPRLNRAWLDQLTISADSSSGLSMGDEPSPRLTLASKTRN